MNSGFFIIHKTVNSAPNENVVENAPLPKPFCLISVKSEITFNKFSIMKLHIVFLSLAIITLTSCEYFGDIELPKPSLIKLEFSTPPFDLQGIDAKFAEDVPYDQYDKTKFDVFLPNSSTPTGLVVFIHGGGFTGGDKRFVYNTSFPEQIIELLAKNLAVATINYRLLKENETVGVLKSLNDSKRAIQYLRYIHKELNIDKEKIVLFGSSAGASTALWIATNDDLKQEDSSDPVLQQSTRVKGVALRAVQSSLDIENRWINDVFSDFNSTLDEIVEEYGEETIFSFYGVDSWEAYESPEIDRYRQRVDMLSLLSSDDPEIWVTNTGGHNNKPLTQSSFNHHPFHARTIKEYADAAGVPNVTKYGNPILFSDPIQEEYIDFFLRKLSE